MTMFFSGVEPIQTASAGMTMNANITSMMPGLIQEQQFCLRWNNYHSNLSAVFDQLYQNQCFVDVTLVGDGRSIKAHKMVLAASSPYFQTIFSETPCKHPVVIIKDVKWEELKALVEFMYRGEINVGQEQIRPLLKLAEMFQIRGLAEVKHEDVQMPVQEPSVEQFTVYAALNSENYQLQTAVAAEDLGCPPPDEKQKTKEREIARKQTLETVDVPVEWPIEEDLKGTIAEVKPKSIRKRKQSSVSQDNSVHNYELYSEQQQAANGPVVAIPQPAGPVSAAPLPPSVATFKPDEDASTKMGFLDSTQEEDTTINAPQEWKSSGTNATESRSKQKAPAWNWNQLQEAIAAVVTQRLRFTQASAQYNIPKGTLYDNILGKAHRMAVLQDLALSPAEEAAVLEFCCDTTNSPYNKRTKKSLKSILEFLARFEAYRAKADRFKFGGKPGFRWWWAFCRKHSIVSLYYEGMKADEKSGQDTSKKARRSTELEDDGEVQQ
ncbi:longitudinals lacking protein, isoforms H/M/V-like [Wyeomyia smithii]|uniref:longitudinals lacking protein, isoforms H/M/V-like n=1 Tax=Wyeomyia smithii TaxID=174621 RepID=UPI002467B2DC|nr:longitudinals lacking protein, isoforms H/M/V-like [Wyeomyia smithii]